MLGMDSLWRVPSCFYKIFMESGGFDVFPLDLL